MRTAMLLVTLLLSCGTTSKSRDSGSAVSLDDEGPVPEGDDTGQEEQEEEEEKEKEEKEEKTEPDDLVFDGIAQATWDGADGLLAEWDAGTGEGSLSYIVTIESLDDGAVEQANTTGLFASVTGLADGEYRLSVEATDTLSQTGGGDAWIDQLVGENRVVYRSEVSVQGHGAGDVWGEDDIVVVAGLYSGISIMVVDIADPAEPIVIAEVVDQGFVKDLKIGDGMLFSNGECGCAIDSPQWKEYDKYGARIYDFADPSDPLLLGAIGEPTTSVHNVAYEDGVLYLTDNIADSVAAWDVSDPADPAFLWYWTPPKGGGVHDQAVIDGTLYVAFWSGFAVIDVSVPTDPVDLVVHEYGPESACHNVWPSADGSHVFTTDEMNGGHLKVWDISDPDAVALVSEWYTDAEHIIHNVHVRDEFAFISYYVDGLVVLDVSDPTEPFEVGSYDTYDEPKDDEPKKKGEGGEHGSPAMLYAGAWGVWPYGDHLAVGDMTRGLIVLDHFPQVVTIND
jgi:hypothetical protein